MKSFLHWWWLHLGLSGGGVWYAWHSGSGSYLIPMTVYIPAVLAFYWRHTCQGKRSCWRWAHHEYDMDGVKHKICHVHHPALQGKKHRFEDFLAHHQAKQGVGSPT